MLTAKLNNGMTVLAKMYHGKPWALTYSNRRQAYEAAAKVGGTVWRGTGRPFYVLVPEAINGNKKRW